MMLSTVTTIHAGHYIQIKINCNMMRFIYISIMQVILIPYVCIINVVTLVMFGVDKRYATRHTNRISERQLYLMIWAGWVLGALIGMRLFRHKRAKPAFVFKFTVISLVRIICLLFYLFYS